MAYVTVPKDLTKIKTKVLFKQLTVAPPKKNQVHSLCQMPI